MGLMYRFISALQMEKDEPMDFEDYLEDANFRIFIPDPKVFENNTPWKQPSIEYVRRLQANYYQMYEEMQKLTLYDVSRIVEEYNDMLIEVGRLKTELAEAKGDISSLTRQLENVTRMQTAGGKKAEASETVGMEFEIKEQQKDSTSNKFQSNNGNSAKDNRMIALVLKMQGYTNSEIAAKVQIGESSVGPYLSEAKKHFKGEQPLDGIMYAVFDKDYDSKWVPIYEIEEEEEYLDDEEETGQGAILKTPIFMSA